MVVYRVRKTIIFVILLIIAATTIFPIFFMFVNSLKTNLQYNMSPYGLPKAIIWSNFKDLFENYNLIPSMEHSIIVSVPSVLVATLLSALASFSFSKLNFKGKNIVYYLILSVMMMPPIVLLIPIYILFSRAGLVDNFISAILVYVATAIPFSTYLLTTNFREIPSQIIESAKIDGASSWKTFLMIILPIGLPTLVTVATLNFLNVWNDLFISFILLNSSNTQMLTPMLATIVGRFTTDMPLLIAGLLIGALPTLLVYFGLSKYLISGVSAGAIK